VSLLHPHQIPHGLKQMLLLPVGLRSPLTPKERILSHRVPNQLQKMVVFINLLMVEALGRKHLSVVQVIPRLGLVWHQIMMELCFTQLNRILVFMSTLDHLLGRELLSTLL
jgi:hypothetical protein